MFYSCALGIVYHTEPELERIPFPRWEMVLGLLFASSILFLILKKKKKRDSNWFVYCLLGERLLGPFEHNTPS